MNICASTRSAGIPAGFVGLIKRTQPARMPALHSHHRGFAGVKP